MHSVVYNYCPPSFRNIWFKRSVLGGHYDLRNNDEYYVPAVKLELFRKIPIYAFATAWNNLGDIKLQHNRFTFQTALKELLFVGLDGLSAVNIID